MSDSSGEVSLKGVNFSYGAVPVIEDADMDIRAGETAILVGPNGGGKTTILRLLLGLEHPQSGTVTVLGTTPELARKDIGYMPQHLRYDNKFPISALEVVLMGRMRRFAFWFTHADRSAALDALDRVGLADSAHKQFSTLSGGQRQRVLIARAMVSQPRLLLFDEPTSMIDAATQGAFMRTLERIRGNCTIIIVSHDIGFVSGMVDHVVLVNRSVSSQPAGGSVKGESFEALYGEKLRMVDNHPHLHSHNGEGLPR
jgi:zinc transport system ATP-binding protein